MMLNMNIRSVSFNFEAGSVVEAALENAGMYKPSQMAGHLERNYSVQIPAVADRDVSIAMNFLSDGKRDKIAVFVNEFIDYEKKDCDFNREAQKLAEFTITLDKALGRKNWQYYIENKFSAGDSVVMPADAERNDEAFSNFHDYLAAKLKAVFRKNGICHRYSNMEDEDFLDICRRDIYMEKLLIGIVLDHSEMTRNPTMIRYRLGL